MAAHLHNPTAVCHFCDSPGFETPSATIIDNGERRRRTQVKWEHTPGTGTHSEKWSQGIVADVLSPIPKPSAPGLSYLQIAQRKAISCRARHILPPYSTFCKPSNQVIGAILSCEENRAKIGYKEQEYLYLAVILHPSPCYALTVMLMTFYPPFRVFSLIRVTSQWLCLLLQSHGRGTPSWYWWSSSGCE
jgi:hypothetical protein